MAALLLVVCAAGPAGSTIRRIRESCAARISVAPVAETEMGSVTSRVEVEAGRDQDVRKDYPRHHRTTIHVDRQAGQGLLLTGWWWGWGGGQVESAREMILKALDEWKALHVRRP